MLLAAVSLAQAGDVRPGPRAVWIWARPRVPPSRSFLQDKANGTAYLYADAYAGRNLIAGQPGRYRTLVRRMHGAGLRAVALFGSGYLHTERYLLPEHRGDAQAMPRRVLDYDAAATPDAHFEGMPSFGGFAVHHYAA
jgi:hypothetical protein